MVNKSKREVYLKWKQIPHKWKVQTPSAHSHDACLCVCVWGGQPGGSSVCVLYGFLWFRCLECEWDTDKACSSSETRSKYSVGLQHLAEGQHVNIQMKLLLSDHELICQLLNNWLVPLLWSPPLLKNVFCLLSLHLEVWLSEWVMCRVGH